MAFPDIAIKATHIELDPTLTVLLTEKLQTLDKFLGEESDVRCEAEFEKIAPHQSGEIHRVEVNLWRAGALFRAEATERNFEAAIDEVRNELDKELRRANDKRDTMLKQGGRKIKEMMRFGDK